jgi:hypothetical protein
MLVGMSVLTAAQGMYGVHMQTDVQRTFGVQATGGL